MIDGKKAPGFMIYDDTAVVLRHLSNDDLGAVIRAIINYKLDGNNEPELSNGLMIAYLMMQGIVDRENAKYVAKCKQNSANRAGGKGKETTDNDRQGR